jgi:hypothetical protein
LNAFTHPHNAKLIIEAIDKAAAQYKKVILVLASGGVFTEGPWHP